MLRYTSSFDITSLHFYDCRHTFRPIEIHQYSHKFPKKIHKLENLNIQSDMPDTTISMHSLDFY